MYFCIKSTQVWVFPERRREVLSFDLQGGGKRGAVWGHENVTLLCVSVEAQFESLHHKSVFLIDRIIELYVKMVIQAIFR